MKCRRKELWGYRYESLNPFRSTTEGTRDKFQREDNFPLKRSSNLRMRLISDSLSLEMMIYDDRSSL